MPPIKVGFIGYGSSARYFHLPYVLPNPDLEVHAFLQRAAAPSDPKKAKAGSHCTIDFPQAKHYTSPEAFFGDDELELVIVCSHGDTHHTFARQALEAGLNVVVEKAFTNTSEQADELIALSKEKGKLLTVFQNRRYDGDFKTLKYLLERDALGDVTEAEIHYDFESPSWLDSLSAKAYTPGAGLMFGLGSHTIDQALLLFGRPSSVTAFLRVLRGIDSEIEDTFTIILQYDHRPLLVTVKTTTTTPMKHQLKYYVRGTKGSYIKHGTDIQEEQVFANLPTTDESFGVEDEERYGVLTTYAEFDSKSQQYDETSKKFIGRYPTITGRIRDFYEDVVLAIRGQKEMPVKPEQSRDGIRVMELARESHGKKATVRWS